MAIIVNVAPFLELDVVVAVGHATPTYMVEDCDDGSVVVVADIGI